METLKGRTAVITGAGSGIGRALALQCAGLGMQVVLADVDEPGLTETARLIDRREGTFLVPTDVSNPDSMEALAERTYGATGDVGVLFNNAGVASGGWIWESTPEDWAWILGVNLMGVVHGIRAFVPRMMAEQRSGHIVNTASAAGLISVPAASAYCASKHAVVTLSECLHHELQLKKADIGVSVLCPSFIQTGIVDSERHRPVTLRRSGVLHAPRDPNLERGMRSATLSADDVARIAIRGVIENTFYVVPHEKVLEGVEGRLSAIVGRRLPQCGSLPSGR
ncbi:MAG: SDR family NAD(P)-dependent oxidoreductase [Burkholderiaceae bacterium]